LGLEAIRETEVAVVPESALAAVVVELVGFRGQSLEPLALPVAPRQQPTPTELPTGMFFPNSDSTMTNSGDWTIHWKLAAES
jgi:hypothetical protein